MLKKRTVFLLIPICAVAVLSLLSLTDFMQTAEKRVSDTLLHIKPAPPEHEQICIVGVNDFAINQAGPWPWPRDIVANGLITMKELGALYVMFDIEYINESLHTVDFEKLENLKQTAQKEFSNINSAFEYLFSMLREQKISFNTFLEAAAQETAISQAEILNRVDQVARNNDDYLGRTARLFENAFFTVNVWREFDNTVPEEARQYVLDNIVLKKVKEQGEYPYSTPEIKPTILPILSGGKGGGFTEVVVDKDGVQRAINLLVKYQGSFLPQVAFAPLLDWLGNPDLEVYGDYIVLKQAKIPKAKGNIVTKNIHIPYNEEGHFLINWLHEPFFNSYKYLSYEAFLDYENYERELILALETMEKNGYLSQFRGEIYPLDGFRQTRAILDELIASGPDPTRFKKQYIDKREQIFAEISDFLTNTYGEFMEQIDAALAQENDPAVLEEITAYKALAEINFSAALQKYNDFMKIRILIQQAIADSFCLIGLTSTATTDIGVTPFDEEYMNVGTHASIVNTILTESFLDNLPWWYSAILALILSIGTAYLLYKLKKPLLCPLSWAEA